MCTVVIRYRPGASWPLILAGNRDEMASRSWRVPGRHWPDRSDVIGGYDEAAGGSWLGLNDFGVVATILNRHGTLGPESGKRSRGELVLEALDHADAVESARALGHIDPAAWRPFNMIVADNRDAFWIAHRADGRVTVTALEEGVSMIAEGDLNDPETPRVAHYLEQFRATEPDDDRGEAWLQLLQDRKAAAGKPVICFRQENGFGTISQSLLALPAPGRDLAPRWRFASVTDQPSRWVEIETRRL